MAGHANAESNYSDDDFDDLPLNALEKLESSAIRLTQAANTQRRGDVLPSSDYGDDLDDEDLDDAVVIDEARCAPAMVPVLRRANLSQASETEQQFLHTRPFGSTSNASRQRQVSLLHQPGRNTLPGPAGLPRKIPVPASQGSQVQTNEAALLRRQVEEMRKELAAVKQDNHARMGEVAVVRGQLERQMERERERAALQKAGEEKLANQRKELEAAHIAVRAAVTERDFIKQDLLEVQRAQNLNKAVEKRDTVTTTPKKKKALPHRDGFDDDEVGFLSPSKLSPSKFQKQIGTPTKAGKRKRKVIDSPIAPLEVVQTEELSEKPQDKGPTLDETSVAQLGISEDDRLEFLGTMLNNCPFLDHPRTIEELGKYALPSRPKESFESIILGQIPTLGRGRPMSDLPVEFCELLISLWRRSFEEKYYAPIYLFIDMLTLALELKTLAIAPHVIDTLVPIAQLTADLVAIPRFGTESAAPYDKDINSSSCLAILHLAALGCMTEISDITRFWRLMRWDFVLLILSINQPTSDFEMMLKILSTSVFRDTFGMIAPDDANTQQKYAGYIIDRLTYPLFETPYMPTGTDKVPADVLLHLRLEILHLLMSMTRSPYASHALANHPNAVGRLVSLMSDELDVLYDYRAGHKSSALVLTLSARLLYYLVTTYELDMQSKLAPIHGGSQKYLLVLSRLNFAEDDLLLESGIEVDVQGLALEMLNLKVTPEEVDEVNGAFLECLRE